MREAKRASNYVRAVCGITLMFGCIAAAITFAPGFVPKAPHPERLYWLALGLSAMYVLLSSLAIVLPHGCPSNQVLGGGVVLVLALAGGYVAAGVILDTSAASIWYCGGIAMTASVVGIVVGAVLPGRDFWNDIWRTWLPA